jgi:sugar phosphate isomerase/epimerase
MTQQFSMSRRMIISSGIAAFGLAALPANAQKAHEFFRRKNLPIGVQLYTVAEAVKNDLDGSFAKLKAMGIETLELAGYHGHTPATLRAAADKAGLRFTSIHLGAQTWGPDPALDQDLAKIAAELHSLGIDQGVVPLFPIPSGYRPEKGEALEDFLRRVGALLGVDDWKRTADMLNSKAVLLQKEGVRLGYHNHNPEFAPLGDTTGWDILLRTTDPKLVTFELDVGWVAAAGLDPVDMLRRFPGRFTLMHVKDIKASTVPNFAFHQDPTEVGSGKTDWQKLIPTAHKAGVRHFYIEQEPPFPGDRFDSVAKSSAFLSALT